MRIDENFSEPYTLDISFPDDNYEFSNGDYRGIFRIRSTNWNGNIAFPKGATSVSVYQTGQQTVNIFNGNMTVPDGARIVGISSALFNKSISIPSSVTKLWLRNCYAFNSAYPTSDSLTDYESVLQGCSHFNQPVKISANATTCKGMFQQCVNFNSEVDMSDCTRLTNCSLMFSGCTKFNQPIVIPDGVTDSSNMFYRCLAFDQTITVPTSVTSVTLMFSNCTSQTKPIYLPTALNSQISGWSANARNCVVLY